MKNAILETAVLAFASATCAFSEETGFSFGPGFCMTGISLWDSGRFSANWIRAQHVRTANGSPDAAGEHREISGNGGSGQMEVLPSFLDSGTANP